MNAIEMKLQYGSKRFYERAKEILNYYKDSKSHKVNTIQAVVNYINCI